MHNNGKALMTNCLSLVLENK